ncbi:MAG: ferric iron uptake transcriptional regulator [Wenzhouxiangella sp.]|nr:MAG: ferric iron uptake transcriptional regulator [Wenzhouxiangella sp.]
MSEKTMELRKVGLKVTHPRLQILRLLESTERKHLTADEIYRMLNEQGDEIGLATVYRVLSQFEQACLVRKHMFDDGSGRPLQACYELHDGEHHDHMVCIETGDVIEFVDPEIEKRQKEIAQKHGYEIVEHSLVIYVKPLKA